MLNTAAYEIKLKQIKVCDEQNCCSILNKWFPKIGFGIVFLYKFNWKAKLWDTVT